LENRGPVLRRGREEGRGRESGDDQEIDRCNVSEYL